VNSKKNVSYINVLNRIAKLYAYKTFFIYSHSIFFFSHSTLILFSLFFCYFFYFLFYQVDDISQYVPRILISVVYSYAIMIEAALSVQRDFEWDEGIKNLVFSSHWVRCLLNRANMRRRKITTDDKKIPTQSEIVRIMEIGQNLIKEKGFDTMVSESKMVGS
jgi:hypothetical protein